MKTNELYLKTIFSCMACDGSIADEEIAVLKDVAATSTMFDELNVQDLLDVYIKSINEDVVCFLDTFLSEVKAADLNSEESIALIELAIKTIESDNNIEYSEIVFFKKIRKNLSVSDEEILAVLPDKEDYLLPDVEAPITFDLNVSFNQITLN